MYIELVTSSNHLVLCCPLLLLLSIFPSVRSFPMNWLFSSGGWRCKEQHCVGTWNVRSMNQDKLEVVKQEMARVNILGKSELKWMGMGEFNSDDHYIYHCGQESLKRNGVALIVNKTVWNACGTWVQSQKRHNDLRSFPSKPFITTVIQVYTLTSNAKEDEVERFYEDLQDFLELTPKRDVFSL